MCTSNTEHYEFCKDEFCRKPLVSKTAIHSGFCGKKCKKSYELRNAVKLSNQYRELGVSLSDFIKVDRNVLVNKCHKEGCENEAKGKKYCSHSCYASDRRKVRICEKPGCENEIKTRRAKTHFCSVECYKESVKTKKISKNKTCNNIVYGNKDTMYCSDVCYKTHKFGYAVNDKKCQKDGCDNKIKQRGSKRKFCSSECYVQDRKSDKFKIGVTSLRSIKKGKRKRRCIKTENGWVLLAKHVWEKANGPTPKGYFINIKDGNTFNDQDINNLELMSFAQSLVNARGKRGKSDKEIKKVDSDKFEPGFYF